MKDRHARYWQGLQGLGSQALNGGGILQSEPEGARVAFVHAVGLLFNPKKIGCGMERSHADQKGTTMAAEVDLQRLSRGLKPSAWNGVRFFRWIHEGLVEANECELGARNSQGRAW